MVGKSVDFELGRIDQIDSDDDMTSECSDDNYSSGNALADWAAARLLQFNVQSMIILFWLVLAGWGFVAAVPFIMRTENPVPPVVGTRAEIANSLSLHYFPFRTVDNGLLVETVDQSPLISLTNRSTCQMKHKMSGKNGGVQIDMSCRNISALGGGCITKADMINDSIELTRSNMKFLAKEQLDDIINNQLMPTLNAQMPDVKYCPERTGQVTDDFLGLVPQVGGELETRFPECDNRMFSFLTVKPQPFSALLKIPLGNDDMNVWINGHIPAGTLWELFAQSLLTEDRANGLLVAQTLSCNGAPVDPYSEKAIEVSEALQEIVFNVPLSLYVRALSKGMMLHTLRMGIEITMGVSSLTVPVAFVIVAAMVKNFRLVICTGLCLLVCLASSIGIVAVIGEFTEVSMFAPTVMIAVALAMSIDYSLFLVTRYEREFTRGHSPQVAVAIMLATSGRVVIVSGCALLLCFASMVIIPVPMIQSFGFSSAVTVCMGVLSSITLTPVTILSFPNFFGNDRRWGINRDDWFLPREWCCCCFGAFTDPAKLSRSKTSRRRSKNFHIEETINDTIWVTYGHWLQKCSLPTLALLLAVGIPIAVGFLPQFSYTIGITPFLPKGAADTISIADLSKNFGVDSAYPNRMLLVPKESVVQQSDRDAWMATTCHQLKNIAAEIDVDPEAPFPVDNFVGLMILGGHCVTGGDFGGMLDWSHVDAPYSATEVMIKYKLDPFSWEGQAWIARLRAAVDKYSENTDWYISGEALSQSDMSHDAFANFALMLTVMMGVVFLLMAMSFKSILAPVRAVVCLLWMLSVTFGVGIWIFQSGGGSMSWMTPTITLPILIGLGLDYDIFYSESVAEYCEKGYVEKEAVVLALRDTANTISAAGAIMIAAFIPLVLSATPLLKQIGTLLCLGILIDCFLTTKVVVPDAVLLLGRLSFWPRSFSE